MHFKKDLLLSKVSLKIIDYTELNSTLNNINNVVGIVNSSEEDIFPIESYSIEEDIFINIIYEVKSLDSEVKSLNSIDFYVPDSSKLTLLCPNDLNISYYAFRNNYFKNSLSFFASVSQLEAFNCLNFTTQDINLTSTTPLIKRCSMSQQS